MAKIIKNNIPYTSIPSSASMLPYDNYDSGLEATNVKDAIDELAAGGTSSTLAGLADVEITSATSGQVLQYNGSEWVNANGGGGGATTLEDLTDVDISSASNGQVLTYSNGEWINNNVPSPSVALNDITDVSVSSPSNGQVLKYNNGDWVNAAESGGASSLNELSDVTITSASSGQVLKYDGTKWANAAESGGTTVIANPSGSSSADLTKLQVDNTIYAIPSGGSDVSVTQIQSTGTKIATITVDSVNTDLYAPNGGASSLNDLTDVTISSATGGQILSYDSATSKWVNTSSLTVVPTTTVLSHGTVSSDSAYVTSTFPDISSNKYAIVKVYDTVSGTDYENFTLIPVNKIGSGISFTLALHVNVTFLLTKTSIKSTSYSGSWQYIYADVMVADTLEGISELTDLTDVNITSVTDGQVLKYDGTTHQWINGSGGGGSGGHTILNNAGTSLTQRNDLQFKGAYSADNNTDAITEVNVVREMTKSQFNLLSADEKVGLIHITDESDAAPLSDLPDVNLTSLADGQILKYDSTNQEWVNANESGGSSSLSGLTDVNITSVSDGQILKYDSSSSKWVNGTGGGGGVSSYDDLTNKPQVNGVTLSGDKDSEDLGIVWEGTQLQYDAIVTKDPNTTYYITDADDGGDSFQPVIYSEIEREIGVWADGKPLYEKTIYNAGGVTGNFTIPHNILNIDRVVGYTGTVKDTAYSTYGHIWVLPRMSAPYLGVDNVTSTNIAVVNPSDFGTRLVDWYIAIQYTKTTDFAGSGTWTPQGVPAVHYSENEQVVGTWFDGSTLYEKTKRVSVNSTGTHTLWTDGSVVVRDYEGTFIFRSSENTLSLCSRPIDNAYKAILEGVGNSAQYGVYADVTLGTSRTNSLDLRLTIRYTKSS